VKKWEFKAFFVYAIVSVLAYPLTQWPFVNHKNPLLIIVIPQFIYSFELFLSSALFLVVAWRMKREQLTGELMQVGPMINLLVKLIYLLIFWDLGIAISFLIINAMYMGYDGIATDAEHAITLGVWDFLQCVFLLNMLCVVITVCFILNVGPLSRMMQGKGIGKTTTTGGIGTGTTHFTSSSKSTTESTV